MPLLTAALLGVVQGLTEFLPVSSSAHLILARAFFGWNADVFGGVAFDVALHVGTLLAVVAFYWTDLLAMTRALPRVFSARPGPDGRRLQLVAIGTVPLVIVGFLWSDVLESDATRTPAVAAVTLFVIGVALLVVERLRGRRGGEETLTAAKATAIGVAQSAALIPGVSRSGSTIAMGMMLGLERAAAARFTFLMSVPAILAAAAKKGLDLRHETLASQDFALFAVGMLTSALVGYITIRLFIQYLGSHRLDVFGWYRIGLAVVTVLWLAAR